MLSFTGKPYLLSVIMLSVLLAMAICKGWTFEIVALSGLKLLKFWG